MKRFTYCFIVSTLITCLTGSTSIANAGYGASMEEPGHHGYRSDIYDKKEHSYGHGNKSYIFGEYWKDTLTGEQKFRLDKTHLEMRKKTSVLRSQIALAEAKLGVLIIETKPDTQEINSKIAEITDWKQSLLEERYAHFLEIREILTPSQRVSFDIEILNGKRRRIRKHR